MANGITKLTREDAQIQKDRLDRAIIRDLCRHDISGVFFNRSYARQSVGYCIGRGLEGDYLDAERITDQLRYSHYLRWASPSITPAYR